MILNLLENQHLQNNTFSTVFLGQNIIKLISVDSTNDYLKKLTSNSEPLPEGTVIMAEQQSAGRGQRECVWETEPGKNLTFSVFLTPNFITPNEAFKLNIMVSLALNGALSKYVSEGLSIKWPNDIYYKTQKLGGILIENSIMGNNLKHTIIGIGLNVNQREFGNDLKGRAISLTQILQQDLDLTVLLGEICSALEAAYLNLRAGKNSAQNEIYTSKLYQLGSVAKYSHNGETFEGVIKGVTEHGLLEIGLLNGKTQAFGFKEVSFL